VPEEHVHLLGQAGAHDLARGEVAWVVVDHVRRAEQGRARGKVVLRAVTEWLGFTRTEPDPPKRRRPFG